MSGRNPFSLSDRKGLLEITFGYDLTRLVIVQLNDPIQKLWEKDEALHDLPLSSSAHCFSHINERYIQPVILLMVFFFEISVYKYHFCDASVGSKATLALFLQSILQNHCDGERSNSSIIEAVWLLPFVLLQSNDDCIVEILWLLSLLSTTGEELVEFCTQC